MTHRKTGEGNTYVTNITKTELDSISDKVFTGLDIDRFKLQISKPYMDMVMLHIADDFVKWKENQAKLESDVTFELNVVVSQVAYKLFISNNKTLKEEILFSYEEE